MIKLLHCADLHLDSPFSRCDRAEAERRRNELRGALSSLLVYAKASQIDVVLIAGDLFDSDYVTKDTLEFLSRTFEKASPVRIFIAPGNHDPIGGRTPYRAVRFPDNVHIFSEEKLTKVELPEKGAAVYGGAFLGVRRETDPLEGFHVEDEDTVNLLCLHGDVDTPHSEYGTVYTKDLAASGFDYAAFGHIHKASDFLRAGKTTYCFCGCLAGRGFDETGFKSAVCGEIGKGNVSLRRERFCENRYEIARVDLDGIRSESEAEERIESACADFGRDTSLRVVLTGNTFPSFCMEENGLAAILPKPRYLELQNLTLPLLDYEKLEKDAGLRGEFYRQIAPLLTGGDAEKRRMAALALKYGLAALSGAELNLPDSLFTGRKG